MMKPVITIVGAGSYGTAIAVALARNGNQVVLWGHDAKHIQNLKTNRSNMVNLPNILFPSLLHLEVSLSKAVNYSKNVLIAVPSFVFSLVLMKLKLKLKSDIRIIIASKGLDPETGRLLHHVVCDILGNNVPISIISGPTFAQELAIGLPTAITLSYTDTEFGCYVQDLLHSVKNLRIYKSTDIIGVQIAGAVKNIIAIGVGISDGMGFGANARTALITRGLAEMSRLGVAMGSTSGVFMGLAGLGDLVLTCTDNQSRNRRFGVLLGQGRDIYYAKKSISQVIEGIYSTKEVYMLSKQYGVTMPITEQIYHILYDNRNIHEAAYSLLNRAYTEELL